MVSSEKLILSVLFHIWMFVSLMDVFSQLNVMNDGETLSAASSIGAVGVPGAAGVVIETMSVNGDSLSAPTALNL